MLSVGKIVCTTEAQAKAAGAYPFVKSELEIGNALGAPYRPQGNPDAPAALGPRDRSAAAAAAYYTERDPVVLGGDLPLASGHGHLSDDLLAELGLRRDRAVDGKAMTNLLMARSADGHLEFIAPVNYQRRHSGKKVETLSGVDCTFSVHKKVTLAVLAAAPDRRKLMLEAIAQAAQESMRFVDESIGYSRRGSASKATIQRERGQIFWAPAMHYTARPTEQPDGSVQVDPQIHVHNFVPNLIRRGDGSWGRIDTGLLRGDTLVIGAQFQALVAEKFRAIGIAMVEEGGAAVPVNRTLTKEAVDAFSSRSKARDENFDTYVDERLDGEPLSPAEHKRLMRAASLASRLGKEAKLEPAGLMQTWLMKMRDLGVRDTNESVRRLDYDAAIEDAIQRGHAFLADRLLHDAHIDSNELRRAALLGVMQNEALKSHDTDLIVRRLIEREIDVRGVKTRLVGYETLDQQQIRQVRLTTELQLETERMIVAQAQQRLSEAGRSRLVIGAEDVEQHFNPERPPTKEQRRAIHFLSESDRTVSSVTGAAGVGKTTLLEPIVRAAKQNGARVIGTAIAWRTARSLADTGIAEHDTYALEKLLLDAKSGRLRFDRPTMIVIDEMSQVDTRRFAEVMDLAKKHGNIKVIAVGDQLQANAIDAGSAMRLAQEAQHVEVTVTQTQRQKGEQADIASAFRGEGHRNRDIKSMPEDKLAWAMQRKSERGELFFVEGGRAETARAAVDEFFRQGGIHVENGRQASVLLTLTNAEARELSGLVRQELKNRGDVGRDDIYVGKGTDGRGEPYDLALAAGDRVRLYSRTNGYDGNGRSTYAGVNGDVLTVHGVDKANQALILQKANGQDVRVPFDRLRDDQSGALKLAPAYAMTADSAQGMTTVRSVDVYLNGTDLAQRNKIYVNQSRHQLENRTFINREAEIDAIVRGQPIGQKDRSQIDDLELLEAATANFSRGGEKSNALDAAVAAERQGRGILRSTALMSSILTSKIENAAVALKQGAMLAREQSLAERIKDRVTASVGMMQSVADRMKSAIDKLRDHFEKRADIRKSTELKAESRVAEPRKKDVDGETIIKGNISLADDLTSARDVVKKQKATGTQDAVPEAPGMKM